MATATFEEFAVEEFDQAPGPNLPQRLGGRLWLPMWSMALMGFAVGFVLAIVRANAISTGSTEATVASLRHVQTGFMFMGFAAVFAAVSFAIARILGSFRTGGGGLQEATGNRVQVLAMPGMAKGFILGMMMAMMAIVIAVIVHFVVGAGVASGSISVADANSAFGVLEGVRRAGVAIYLFSIALGLGTIIMVLRYQSSKIRSLARRV